MRLECRNLNFSYPGSDGNILENMSFLMESPGFNCIFGPSGVGKTSFASLLARPGQEASSSIHLTDIHTVLYSYNMERLPGWASTGSHLDKICPRGKEEMKDELIQVFEVGPILSARFSQLSMGQQNRMNLIRYLLQDFDLLILDESLANVDEKLRGTIILHIKERFADKMFLYISHNLMEVAKYCNQILVLGHGAAHRENGCLMVQGRDLHKGDSLDKSALDAVILEIMNAF